MISESIYRRVRNGVCAVGYLTGTLEDYLKHLESDMFQVIGTGFLIGDATVLTNRHVIAGLLEAEITQVIPRRQLFIQFVAPKGRQSLQLVPRIIREVSYLDDPKLDIGFIKYKVINRGHFRSIRPLEIVAGISASRRGSAFAVIPTGRNYWPAGTHIDGVPLFSKDTFLRCRRLTPPASRTTFCWTFEQPEA